MRIPPKLIALSDLEASKYDGDPELTECKARDFVASLAQTNGMRIWVYGGRILKGRYRVACLRLLGKTHTIVHDIKPFFDQAKWTWFTLAKLDYLYTVLATTDRKIYERMGLNDLAFKEAQALLLKLRAINAASSTPGIVIEEAPRVGLDQTSVPSTSESTACTRC